MGFKPEVDDLNRKSAPFLLISFQYASYDVPTKSVTVQELSYNNLNHNLILTFLNKTIILNVCFCY